MKTGEVLSLPPASPPVDGLYVHIPFCDGKCDYCAFYSVSGRDAATDAYLAALEAELVLRLRGQPRPVPRTIYIGGGTPTLLQASQLARLARMLARHLDLRRLEEWTVEANPGTLDAARLKVLKEAGVTRISLGVQAFDDATLRRLGRRHTVAQVHDAVLAIRAAGFVNWSLDLIACVPGVTARQWADTVRTAVALEPRHVSVYALTSEEGSRLAGQVSLGKVALLDDEAQLARLLAAERVLRAAGFGRYEISNYARPGFECRHNLDCWRGASYLGLGCAASSFVDHMRRTNAPDIDAYLAAYRAGVPPPGEEERLSPETEAVERLIFGLRMAEGVALPAVPAAAGGGGAGLAARWAAALERLRRDGLVRRRGVNWFLTARGRDLADYVAVELMP